MENQFENLPEDLKDLKPKVKEKALEIALKLSKEKKYQGEELIREAVKRAEEWFYESEG